MVGDEVIINVVDIVLERECNDSFFMKNIVFIKSNENR